MIQTMSYDDYVQKFTNRGFHHDVVKKGLELFGSKLTESDLMELNKDRQDDMPIPQRGVGVSYRSRARNKRL